MKVGTVLYVSTRDNLMKRVTPGDSAQSEWDGWGEPGRKRKGKGTASHAAVRCFTHTTWTPDEQAHLKMVFKSRSYFEC